MVLITGDVNKRTRNTREFFMNTYEVFEVFDFWFFHIPTDCTFYRKSGTKAKNYSFHVTVRVKISLSDRFRTCQTIFENIVQYRTLYRNQNQVWKFACSTYMLIAPKWGMSGANFGHLEKVENKSRLFFEILQTCFLITFNYFRALCCVKRTLFTFWKHRLHLLPTPW